MGCAESKGKDASQKVAEPAQKDQDKRNGDKAKDTVMSKGQFIVDNAGKIHEVYNLDKKKLGEGSYGSVFIATNKKSKEVRAVKTIAKAAVKDMSILRREITIMKAMDHPHIIKLYETFEDNRSIHLAMELCAGGELFDTIIEINHFNEAQAAHVMEHILLAINYMHTQFVCHRDLKPENFLFQKKGGKGGVPIEENMLKIIDFGLSCKFKPGVDLKTKAGTPYYVAPQVLNGKYNQACDIWSCGVIMFVLLVGYPPFFGDSDAEVLAKVRLGSFNFVADDWANVSNDAKDLIRAMLKLNVSERFTAEQVLSHTWIKHKAPKSAVLSLQRDFVGALRGFRSQNKLQKAALHIIATNLDEDNIKNLQQIFRQLDVNSDGCLTYQEMIDGLSQSLSEIPKDLEDILKGIDSDGSGQIDYTEFLAAAIDKRKHISEAVLWGAFCVFDKNGDGRISMDELKQVLQDGDVQSMTAAETLQTIMKEADSNGDGMIDFDEFKAMVMQRPDVAKAND